MQVGDVTLDAIYDQQSLEFFIAPDVTLIQVHRDMLGEFGVYLLNLWEPIAQEMPAHELLLNVSLDHWGGISYDTPLLYTPQSNLPRPIFAAPDLDPNVDLSGL